MPVSPPGSPFIPTMLFTLALKIIREKKFRTLLASLSIAIGTASLIVFLGLSNGIQQATFSEIEKKSPLTQITVRPKIEKTGVISLLSNSTNGKLTSESLEEIAEIKGVKVIHPEIQFQNFASLEIPIFGMTLATETMVFGVPGDLIANDLQSPEIWDQTVEPYPALIPRKILDLYNLAVAGPQNLPALSEEALIGQHLTFLPNYSSFFPDSNDKTETIRLKVAGFSDRVNLIGVTLPYKIVEEFNRKYGKSDETGSGPTDEPAKNATNPTSADNSSPAPPTNFLELFVETENAADTASIAGEIEKLGYSTFYFQKNLQDVDAKFAYLRTSLGMISLIILLTAAIAIVSTFLATIAERTKEIGLFRALGATKNQIKKLILMEAGIIGILGSGMGIILGLIASKIIDRIGLKQLESTTFDPVTLFNVTPTLILNALVFGTLLSILAAYIPARQAAEISPIDALKRL